MNKTKLIQYFCYGCRHQWAIIPGQYNKHPTKRMVGKCYCGKKFPKMKEGSVE